MDYKEIDPQLVERQLTLQRSTDRNRTIDEYDRILFPSKDDGIPKLLRKSLKDKDSAVWVDIGSGNGVAMRQAKLRLIGEGYTADQIKTYGVDILSFDLKDLRDHIHNFSDDYEEDLASLEFAPDFVRADAASVHLPEETDLATIVEMLKWADDPLAIVKNVADQLKAGGVIGLNNLHQIYYISDPDARSSQNETILDHLKTIANGGAKGGLPVLIAGFDTMFVGDTQSGSSLVLRKSNPEAKFPDFRLVSKTGGSDLRGFTYHYTDK